MQNLFTIVSAVNEKANKKIPLRFIYKIKHLIDYGRKGGKLMKIEMCPLKIPKDKSSSIVIDSS